MWRMKRKKGLSPAASSRSTGIVTSLRFSALGLRPVSHEPQPGKSMYFWKPRAAGLPLKPMQTVV